MSTPTRIYIVKDKDPPEPVESTRLVRAANPSQALRHVATEAFTVDVATQDDLVRALGDGITVETAGGAE